MEKTKCCDPHHWGNLRSRSNRVRRARIMIIRRSLDGVDRCAMCDSMPRKAKCSNSECAGYHHNLQGLPIVDSMYFLLHR